MRKRHCGSLAAVLALMEAETFAPDVMWEPVDQSVYVWVREAVSLTASS
jgi:hypothetical protein